MRITGRCRKFSFWFHDPRDSTRILRVEVVLADDRSWETRPAEFGDGWKTIGLGPGILAVRLTD